MAGNSGCTLSIIFRCKLSGETWESWSEVLQPGLGRELDSVIIIVLLFLKPHSMGSSRSSACDLAVGAVTASCATFYCKCCIQCLLVKTIEKEKMGRVKQSINVRSGGG